jgi:hypothetical protein
VTDMQENNRVTLWSRGGVFLKLVYWTPDCVGKEVAIVGPNQFTLDRSRGPSIGTVYFVQPDRPGFAGILFRAYDDHEEFAEIGADGRM